MVYLYDLLRFLSVSCAMVTDTGSSRAYAHKNSVCVAQKAIHAYVLLHTTMTCPPSYCLLLHSRF